MSIYTSYCYLSTYISCKIKNFIFALMVVRWRLDEEVLVSVSVLVESIMTKCGKVMIKHSVSIVLCNATQLDDTVHLLRIWYQISFTHELFEVLAVKLERFLSFRREAWVLLIFFPVVVLMDKEWWYECHDRLEERIHDS